MSENILVTGAFGQIGSDLVPALQERYGNDNVVALGHKNIASDFKGILEKGNVTDKEGLKQIIEKHNIKIIYHLASILSAAGEKKPHLTWEANINGLKNVLDIAVDYNIKVFWPSSIAVFGPTTPRDNTPQRTVLEPTTMYGVTKLAGEMLCQYYYLKFDVDIRSVRYPGIISYKTEPGNGTTDYAVAIFYGALKEKKYTCFVRENTVLPMMYMEDALNAAVSLMEADSKKITIRTSYNLAAVSFSAKELEMEIKKHIPEFSVSYEPDERQKIADSWPQVIDDSVARKDWNWQHKFSLSKTTEVMLEKLKEKLTG